MVENIEDIKKSDCYRYAEEVLNGNIVTGMLTQLACKRFMSDLERDDLEFRLEIGDKFVKFASVLKHFKGRSNGKKFTLELWQKFVIYNILCWYWRGTEDRRFTSSLLCISRKQGKTALAALLCLWFLLFDREGAPEVDLSANSLQQSNVAYEFVETFARQLDPKQKDLRIYRKQVKCKLNGGVINVFASDSTKLDGFNASFCLVDEYGAAKDTKMYDVLKSSMGQRQNPHIMTISTTGFDLSGPLYKMYQVDSEILHGLKSDDSHFAMIFSLDEDDDYKDPKNFLKIAPNLGITVNEKFLQDEIIRAQNDPSAEVGVLTKTFNKWCSSAETWISQDWINKVSAKVSFEDFDQNSITYVGIDLAATSDLTCLSFLMTKEDDDKLYFKNLYYLPQTALKESPNRERYKYWQRTGQLIVTPDNVTDYNIILNDLIKRYNQLYIKKVGYDSWNATQFVISATEQGMPMEPVSQAISNLSKPTKTLERLIKMGKVVIDNNEINRFCFSNATPKIDWNENVKITKSSKDSKIDGVIAIIMALAVFLETPMYSVGLYTL